MRDDETYKDISICETAAKQLQEILSLCYVTIDNNRIVWKLRLVRRINIVYTRLYSYIYIYKQK